MKARDILEAASTLLLDEEYTRWTLPELVRWLNEGVKAICLAKPSAYSLTQPLVLQQGTRQALPTAATSLLRVVRNLKDQASPPAGGRIVTPVPVEDLDASDPYWHDGTVTTFKKEVRNFVYSEDDPQTFYCYPGNDGTGILEIVIAALPTPVAATGDVNLIASYDVEIGIEDIYTPALVDYVCFRSQSKDDDGAMPGRASAHYSQFATAVGLKVQNSAVYSPSNQNARK